MQQETKGHITESEEIGIKSLWANLIRKETGECKNVLHPYKGKHVDIYRNNGPDT